MIKLGKILIVSIFFLGFLGFVSTTQGFKLGPEPLEEGWCLTWMEKLANFFLPASKEYTCLAPTITTTGNFPATLNNFQDNDIINAGDWNNIEQAIGATSTVTSTALNYLVRNTSSVNPGHKHTTASVSGTIAVAQGGTATSSFTYGLVIASSTNAFDTLRATTNGQVPIASGTTWTTNTLTTGSGISITNGAGSITIANTGIASTLIDASSTQITNKSSAASTTLLSVVIPSSTLIGTNLVKVTLFFSSFEMTTGAEQLNLFADYGSSTVGSSSFMGNADFKGKVEYFIQANTTTSQIGTWFASFGVNQGGGVSSTISIPVGSAVENVVLLGMDEDPENTNSSATSSKSLVISEQCKVSNGNCGVIFDSYVVEKIINQ